MSLMLSNKTTHLWMATLKTWVAPMIFLKRPRVNARILWPNMLIIGLVTGHLACLALPAKGLILLNLLLLGLYLIYLQRQLVRPVLEITSVATRIAEGQANLSVNLGSRQDELADLANAFNRMTTQLNDSNEKLKQALSSRDDFLSVASHELKTPITALGLQLQITQRAISSGKTISPASTSALKAVSISLRQVARLTTLIEDLLDVTKIRAGKLDIRSENFDLAELVRDQIELNAIHAQEAGCVVSLFASQRIPGLWDRFRVEQIVANLLSNAFKYAPGHAVHVTVDQDSAMARISVRDFGPGIPKEKQSDIFERFERASSSQHISGLGLGLFIVKHISEAHEGSVTVISEPAQGAEFEVRLPLRATGKALKHEVKFCPLKKGQGGGIPLPCPFC